MSGGLEKAIRLEREAWKRLEDALETIRGDLSWYWDQGDGCGGAVLHKLAEIVREEGCQWPLDPTPPSKVKPKAKISRSLSKRVMERDEYRCVECGDHFDLTCDHIIPEAKGGETTFENLQTMCRSCNSRKGTKLPEDAPK